MNEFAPCTACKRHVAIGEIACPFCGVALGPLRAQRFMPKSLARAAIFSAALAGCSDPKPSAPAKGSAGSNDDLENLLDHDSTTVQRATPPDAPTPDAMQVAAVDAGVRPDAGVDQQALAEKRRRDAERRKREQQRILDEQRLLQEQQRMDMHQHAKPYGAPPARKRIV